MAYVACNIVISGIKDNFHIIGFSKEILDVPNCDQNKIQYYLFLKTSVILTGQT